MNPTDAKLSSSQEALPLETQQKSTPKQKVSEAQLRTQRMTELYEQISAIKAELEKIRTDQHAQNEQSASQDDRSLSMLSDISETQNAILEAVQKLSTSIIYVKPRNSMPFLDEVELAAKNQEDNRSMLLGHVHVTLDALNSCSDISASLSKQCNTVKLVEKHFNSQGLEITVHPKMNLDIQLNDYIGSNLSRVLLAVPVINKLIKKELKALIPFQETLTDSQIAFIDESTKLGNTILLMGCRLPLEKKLMQQKLSHLPDLKHLNAAIIKANADILEKKRVYQIEADWNEVKEYVDLEKAKFKQLHDEAIQLEKTLKQVFPELKPLQPDANSQGAFFAHSENLQKLNQKNWQVMEKQINDSRAELKASILDLWKSLHTEFLNYSAQIIHLSDAASRSSFSYKILATRIYSSGTDVANVTLVNPAVLASL